MYSQGWPIEQPIYVCGLLVRYFSDYFLRPLFIYVVCHTEEGPVSEGARDVTRQMPTPTLPLPLPDTVLCMTHNIYK